MNGNEIRVTDACKGLKDLCMSLGTGTDEHKAEQPLGNAAFTGCIHGREAACCFRENVLTGRIWQGRKPQLLISIWEDE